MKPSLSLQQIPSDINVLSSNQQYVSSQEYSTNECLYHANQGHEKGLPADSSCSESSDGDWDPHRTIAEFLVSERTHSARLEEMIDWHLQSVRIETGAEVTARRELVSFCKPPRPTETLCYGARPATEESRTDFTTVFIADSIY